eukprot:11107381-Ditylum_brightwellii.AAC.1
MTKNQQDTHQILKAMHDHFDIHLQTLSGSIQQYVTTNATQHADIKAIQANLAKHSEAPHNKHQKQ